MAYFGHTDPLDADEEIVLGPASTDRADAITGAIYSDVVGTIIIEQSGDGENWDISTEYDVAADDGKGFSEPLYLPWVRIRYINGSGASTATRIFSRFSSAGDS